MEETTSFVHSVQINNRPFLQQRPKEAIGKIELLLLNATNVSTFVLGTTAKKEKARNLPYTIDVLNYRE